MLTTNAVIHAAIVLAVIAILTIPALWRTERRKTNSLRPEIIVTVHRKQGGSFMPSRSQELADLKARHEQEVADFIAANPSAFVKADDLDPDAVASAAEVMLRKHLRRFPKTDCALALSLKALYEGTSSTYTR